MKQEASNFRFSLCIIIVSHFYCPTNALNYTKLCVYGPTGWELVPSRPDRTHTQQVQNYATKHRLSTRQNICESPTSNFSQAQLCTP